MLWAFWLAFTSYDMVRAPRFVGLENFVSISRDPIFTQALTNTLVYIAGSTAAILAVALGLAMAINTRTRGARACMSGIFLSNIMPIIAVCLVWRFLFHPHGLVNQLLSPFGFGRIDWLTSETLAMPAIIGVTVWRFAPYFMVIFLAALVSIPSEFYEAAALDGATGPRRFRYVTLPLLYPVVFFVIVVSALLCARLFLMPYIITGGGPGGATRVLSMLIYETGFSYLKMGRAAAIAVVLFAIVLALNLFQMLLFMRDEEAIKMRPHLRWLGLLPLARLTLLLLLPVLCMLSTSFHASEKMFQLAMEWIPSAWHPENYPNALRRAPFPLFFLNSIIVSMAVMAGNIVFCTLAGYGLAKFRFPGDRFALLAILTTLMLPLEVTLVPTFLIVHSLGWLNTYQGIFAPLLVDAFGIFLMRQFVLGIPGDYLEAARIDGAGELRILWRIVLPQCRPALAVLALFAFRDSWDQFLWPLAVVSRDEYRTYPLGLVRFAEDYGNPQTEQMAIAVMATIPVFVLFVLLQRLLKKGFGLTGLKG